MQMKNSVFAQVQFLDLLSPSDFHQLNLKIISV